MKKEDNVVSQHDITYWSIKTNGSPELIIWITFDLDFKIHNIVTKYQFSIRTIAPNLKIMPTMDNARHGFKTQNNIGTNMFLYY